MNPYKVLGVKKNASKAAIEKAYRKRLMEVHPDRGGSEEQTREVQTAYEVLSNEEARQHYDETGEIEPPKHRCEGDPAQIERVVLIFRDVVGNMIRANEPVGSIDIINRIAEVLQRTITSITNERSKVQKGLDVIKTMAGKFSDEAGGDCLFNDVVESEIASLQAEVALHTKRIDQVKSDIELVLRFKYEHTKALNQANQTTSGPFTIRDIINGVRVSPAGFVWGVDR